MLEKQMQITVLVPCFNEAEVLPLLYQRLKELDPPLGVDLHFLLVDDGSTDNTWHQLCSFANDDPNWSAISLSRNFGHQNALWIGLENIDSDAVFVVDADLQDPPELIEEFVAAWQDGADVVYGVREKRKESFIKRVAYKTFYRILNYSADVWIPPDAGDFCLIDRRVQTAMLSSRQSSPFLRGLRAWVGFKQVPLKYERFSRAAGKEKYDLPMLCNLAVNGLFGYSKKPLRLTAAIGFMLFGLGVLFFLGGAVGLLFGGVSTLGLAVAAVLAAITSCTGLILGAIGIIGEYVAQIHEASLGRPVAIISETTVQSIPFKRPKIAEPSATRQKAA